MNQKDSELNRAAKGDEVWVLLNHVKADKWEQHKDFVLNILLPAAKKVAPTEMANSRFLYTTDQNEDGTYTSIWLIDPVIENGNYNMQDCLKMAHGDEKGEEYFQLWTESLATDQVDYSVIQSPW